MEGQDAAKAKVHPADKAAAEDAILARAHAIKVRTSQLYETGHHGSAHLNFRTPHSTLASSVASNRKGAGALRSQRNATSPARVRTVHAHAPQPAGGPVDGESAACSASAATSSRRQPPTPPMPRTPAARTGTTSSRNPRGCAPTCGRSACGSAKWLSCSRTRLRTLTSACGPSAAPTPRSRTARRLPAARGGNRGTGALTWLCAGVKSWSAHYPCTALGQPECRRGSSPRASRMQVQRGRGGRQGQGDEGAQQRCQQYRCQRRRSHHAAR